MALQKIQKYQNCYPTVTEDQIKWMCNTTLEEFCDSKKSDHYFDVSTRVLRGLGYIHEDHTLAMDHNVLTTVWELNRTLPEAVHLCAILEQLYIRFCYGKTRNFKESDSTQNEFLSVLLHVVDRVPAKDGQESLQQLLRVVPSEDGSRSINEDARQMWLETEKNLREQKDLIDKLDVDQEVKDALSLVIPPGKDDEDIGLPLDKGVYEMLVSKQKGFNKEQETERRNELKNRIVSLGHICQIAHNNLHQPHGKYSELEVHFRRMFSNIKYSVADMMNQLTDQDDLTEV